MFPFIYYFKCFFTFHDYCLPTELEPFSLLKLSLMSNHFFLKRVNNNIFKDSQNLEGYHLKNGLFYLHTNC